MGRLSRQLFIVGAAVLALGCNTDEPAQTGLAERDSAGIVIREYPAIPPEDFAQLRGFEAVSIGALEGDETETFNRIGDMATDAQGRLHVLDVGDQVVDVYAPDGSWVLRYGGRGEGPAEFQGAALLIPFADSMAVFDYRNQKIALFGSDGSLLTTRRWELSIFEFGFPSDLSPIPGGVAGVFETGCGMPPPEDLRATWKLLTLGHDGEVNDTVVVHFRQDLLPIYGDRFCSAIPALAGPAYELAVQNDGTAAYTDGREYEISLLRLGTRATTEYQGTIPTPDRIVRRALDPASVTPAQIEDYRDRYLTPSDENPLGEDRIDAIREALDSTETPESHPQIDNLLWDDLGRLWVGRTVVGDTQDRTWDVYDDEARLLAQAVLPASLKNVVVHGNMAWGTVQDDLGVMYVKGFRLEEENPSSSAL